jgi:hypothetical protein
MFDNYCIMTSDIGGMGGAQLYTIRRLKYLCDNNCRVFILTGSNLNFKLEKEFEGVEILVIPEIALNPMLFSKKRITKVYTKIINFLHNKSINIIESHSLANSIYAENIANSFKCKHIIYLLNEDKIRLDYGPGYSNFFYFKLNRGELFGVSSRSLNIITSGNIDNEKNKFINIPYDTNELSYNKNDSIKKYLPLQNINLKILTIARLDKSYIDVLIEAIMKVSYIFPDKTFFLLIIGGSTNNRIIENLRKKFRSTKNFNIVFSGYIYPIPAITFNSFDLFIGQGTASVSSISQGCPTAIISDDYRSPGFLGIDTNNFGYPEKNIKNIPIEDLLILIINEPKILHFASEAGQNLFIEQFECVKVMNHFNNEILKSSELKDYWLFSFKNNLRNILEYIFIYFFGINKYFILFNKIARYLK